MTSFRGSRGAEAESHFCTVAIQLGYVVCFPARGLSPAFDMVLARDGKLYKVQVKRVYPDKEGYMTCHLKSYNGQRYSPDDVDLFGLVDFENRRVWMMPNTPDVAVHLRMGERHDKWLVQEGDWLVEWEEFVREQEERETDDAS
jgi:hypothetical protein